ncbi:MAG: hypothetical protein ACHQ51_05995 [Elusimicrobiota bacterium]
MRALCFFLITASSARAGAVPASENLSALPVERQRALCLSEVTPDGMIVHQFGDESREGLYDFATCTELVKKEASLCAYFPGGPAAKTAPALKLRRYKVVGGDAANHLVFEYTVCDSRSAGYLLLAGLVAGEPRDSLLPYARRMLNAEPSVKAEDLVDVSSEVYHSRALRPGRLPELVRRGFFNYLLGSGACAGIESRGLRRECDWKGAAADALRARDRSLCRPRDLMCRALFDGEKTCRAVGREAVRIFCTREFPLLKPSDEEWSVMRSKL